MFNGDLIIDSNIWMKTGEEFDRFFAAVGHALAQTPHHILLSQAQLAELHHIQARTAPGTSLHNAACLALHRIGEFRHNQLLQDRPLPDSRRSRAYADPVIKRQVLEKAFNGEAVTLLSDDKDLCSKVRAAIRKFKGHRVKIYHAEKIAGIATGVSPAAIRENVPLSTPGLRAHQS